MHAAKRRGIYVEVNFMIFAIHCTVTKEGGFVDGLTRNAPPFSYIYAAP
jgi:hypothetical protein